MLGRGNRQGVVTSAFLICLVFCIITSKADDSNADLCESFSAFRDVITYSRVKWLLISQHIFDFRLWHSMAFLKSSEFQKIVQEITSSAFFDNIVKQFEQSGMNVDVLNKCLDLSVPEIDEDNEVVIPQERSLSSFANGLVNNISKQAFYNTVAQEIANSQEFANFYKTVQSADFQAKVTQGLASPALSGPIKELRQNGIDLQQLMALAFKVISWGPRVN